jgi:hypothetical protein
MAILGGVPKAWERAMRRADWQAEAQAVRNVAEAIRRVLAGLPPGQGSGEAALWAAIESCGVTRSTFDAALRTLETGRVVRRAGWRVFSERGTDDG